MIGIVLAAGLGTNFIIVALLFRRDRELSRQLSDMRAERNSEWILHALRDVPDERERAAPAASGDSQPHAAGGQPIRRKKHLGLYLGGGSAAVATALWRTFLGLGQRSPLLAGAAGIATVIAVAAVLTGAHSRGHPHARPPSHAWTATPTATASGTPRGNPSAAPDGTSPGKPTPTVSVSPSALGGPSLPTPPADLDTAESVVASPPLPTPSTILGGRAAGMLRGQLLPTHLAIPGSEASSGVGLPPARSEPRSLGNPLGHPRLSSRPAFTTHHTRR